MSSSPSHDNLSPEEQLQWRAKFTQQTMDIFDKAEELLNRLDILVDKDWVTQQLKGESLGDLCERFSKDHACLMTYINAVSKEGSVPDRMGGDKAEVIRIYKDIHYIATLLDKLVTPHEAVRETKTRNGSKADDSGSFVQTLTTTDSYKKKSAYILPGVYAQLIQEALQSLQTYTMMSAPLLGIQLKELSMTGNTRPSASVKELREFVIRHKAMLDPSKLGVPSAWIKELEGVKINFPQESLKIV